VECALQSLYDPDQHQTNKTAEFINAHGKWLLATMNRTILQVGFDASLFSYCRL
jgi:hypothetical protein